MKSRRFWQRPWEPHEFDFDEWLDDIDFDGYDNIESTQELERIEKAICKNLNMRAGYGNIWMTGKRLEALLEIRLVLALRKSNHLHQYPHWRDCNGFRIETLHEFTTGLLNPIFSEVDKLEISMNY